MDYDKVINNHILHYPEPISDEKMNYLFNACDVGINSCIGEGFGLCNIEHASLGKPQIVSKVCSFKDIFEMVGHISFVEPRLGIHIAAHIDDHNGYVNICSSDDFAAKIEEVYDNYEGYKEEYGEFRNYLLYKYNWGDIFERFLKDFIC